jgi:hypothetical protein
VGTLQGSSEGDERDEGLDAHLECTKIAQRVLFKVTGRPRIIEQKKKRTPEAGVTQCARFDPRLYLLIDLDGHQFRSAPGSAQRLEHFLRGQFPHGECQTTFDGCLNWITIDPQRVFNGARAATIHFHHKFCALQSSISSVWISAEKDSLHR